MFVFSCVVAFVFCVVLCCSVVCGLFNVCVGGCVCCFVFRLGCVVFVWFGVFGVGCSL